MTLRNFSSTAAETTLSAGVAAANTTLEVSATTGFPAVPFILAVDAGAAAQELVLVTNVAGTTLTVTRGYDSTVAVAHEVGAVVAHSHAALDFREANTHVNASTGVHGTAGAVVGTTDAQTLTNKTLALGSNTVSGTKAQFNTAMTDADFASLAGAEVLTNKDLTSTTNTFPGTSSGVTNGTNVNAAASGAYRRTNIIIVVVSAQATAALAGGATLFTLPVGYRPPALCYGEVVNTSTGVTVRLDIATTGVVAIGGAIGNGETVRGQFILPL